MFHYLRHVRRIAIFAVLAGLAGSAAWAAPPPIAVPPLRTQFNAQDSADLKRISAYLDTLKNIQGRFLQVAGNGKSEQGIFYLRKPGRVRFEYQKPNPVVIVADGATVAVENSDLKTTDRYPLGSSPLRLLLSEGADLSTDPRIASLKREPGALSVTAREASGPAQGSITMTFSDSSGLELRQWEVVDAQGARTTISVNDMRQVAELPPHLFIIRDLSPFKQTGR